MEALGMNRTFHHLRLFSPAASSNFHCSAILRQWTMVDDQKVISLHKALGPAWTMICQQMSGKNPIQIMRRFYYLQEKSKQEKATNSLPPTSIEIGEKTMREDAGAEKLSDGAWYKFPEPIHG